MIQILFIFSFFIKFQVFVENHFDWKIKTFQSDGGIAQQLSFLIHMNQMT